MILLDKITSGDLYSCAPDGLYLSPAERARLSERVNRHFRGSSKTQLFAPTDRKAIVLKGNILVDTRSHNRACGKWDCDFWDETSCNCTNADKHQVGKIKTKIARYLSEQEILLFRKTKDEGFEKHN